MKTYTGSSDADKVSVRDVPSETTAEHSHVEVSGRDRQDQLSPSVLRRTLIDAIQEGLSFPARSEGIAEYSGLFAAYIDDVAVLETRRKEIFDLIEAMKLTGVELDIPEEFTEEARALFQKTIQQDYTIAIDRPLNSASADLAALPLDQLRERLRNALKQACETLVTQLMNALDNLVDRKIVGLVHWTSQNAVKYDFFRRRIHCDQVQVSGSRKVVRRLEDEAPDDSRRWKRVTKRLRSSNFICVLEHHKHDAVDAFQTSIENSKVVMPEGVLQLIRGIPDWMRPSIRILDGYLIGEKVHYTETCRETIVKTSVVEEPLHGHEPAVALGPYVLVGWGPREIAAVLSQRTAATEEKRWRDQRWQWCGGALVAQLLIPPVLMASSVASGMLLLAALLFLFSIPMLTLALGHHLALKGITLSEWKVQLLIFGPAIVAAGVQSLFLPIGPVRFFLSSVLILCGAWMIHSSRPHLLDGSKT